VKRVRRVAPKSHYDWLDEHFETFLTRVYVAAERDPEHAKGEKGLISAHGDKCYAYREEWAAAGIPFEHGVAVYLLSYLYPWSNTVRKTDGGWVAPKDWVIAEYPKYKGHMPAAYKAVQQQQQESK
jgi:hypothetical protein